MSWVSTRGSFGCAIGGATSAGAGCEQCVNRPGQMCARIRVPRVKAERIRRDPALGIRADQRGAVSAWLPGRLRDRLSGGRPEGEVAIATAHLVAAFVD